MSDYNNNEHIYSERLRAGKRTYFFDVKETQGGDYYLVITESRRNSQTENSYTKHKLFLYKEDLNRFVNCLTRTTDHIKTELLPEYDFDQERKSFYNDNEDHIGED